jgi:hypothetical protein
MTSKTEAVQEADEGVKGCVEEREHSGDGEENEARDKQKLTTNGHKAADEIGNEDGVKPSSSSFPPSRQQSSTPPYPPPSPSSTKAKAIAKCEPQTKPATHKVPSSQNKPKPRKKPNLRRRR